MDQDPKKIVVPVFDFNKKKQEIEAIFQPLKEIGENMRAYSREIAKRYDEFRLAEIENVRRKIDELKTPSAILLFLKQEKIRLQKMIADAQEKRNKGDVKFLQSVIDEVLEKRIVAYEEEVKFEKEKTAALASPFVNVTPIVPPAVKLIPVSVIQPPAQPNRRKKSNSPAAGRQANRGKVSFFLKVFTEDKFFFRKHHKIVGEVLHKLKSGDRPFFDPKTSTAQFQAILSGEIIKRSDRISWTGSLYELSQFVKLLDYELELIHPLKNDIWLTTVYCFTHNGKDILPEQVRNANGSKKRVPGLKTLLVKLTAQHPAISPGS